jgi:hypothetical protein
LGHELIITCGIAQKHNGPPILVKYFRLRKDGKERAAVAEGTNDISMNSDAAKMLALQALERLVRYVINDRLVRKIRGPSMILHSPASKGGSPKSPFSERGNAIAAVIDMKYVENPKISTYR